MKNKALYAGSFDPITKGHLDIIKRASKIFNEIVVGIGENTRKKPLLSIEERLYLLNKVIKHENLENVTATYYKGMTVDYANSIGANILIRGLRNTADFQVEFQIAVTNKILGKGIETLFLTTSPEYNYINSCLVKEIAKSRGDISPFVPPIILEDLINILKTKI